jgi:hypothetical protein
MEAACRGGADVPRVVHDLWTRRRQHEPPETALGSPLLALHASSDVDPVLPEQIADARSLLRALRSTVAGPRAQTRPGPGRGPVGQGGPVGQAGPAESADELRRRIVARFLSGRRGHFGSGQCAPLDEVELFVAEGRDVFVVVKFMDEAPHLAATLHSLLGQRGVDPGRVVIVAADNNSTDGSDRVVAEVSKRNRTAVRVVHLNQSTPGAGNTARLGVDRCIATVYRMCELDGDWSRLHHAVIGVSDGDTVYHPRLLGELLRIFDTEPATEAVMPFLTYKLTAATRLFAGHLPADPAQLAAAAGAGPATATEVDLTDAAAFTRFPRHERRHERRRDGDGVMLLGGWGGPPLRVQLRHVDHHGRRFGVLRDPAGRLGFVLGDRTLVLAEAPATGDDTTLVFLENGGVRPEEKWRWHALIGHELFLRWLFAGNGVPVEMVYPDTSDALKLVRAWAFAIGGQHQLRRPGLRIVTGSDYQSGRVVQAAGGTVRLAPADAYAETEIDRLAKMVRNLARDQSVFYGALRSSALERASGLYVHMTRIQPAVEQEVRTYPDSFFQDVVFPERVLLSLRWVLQNALRLAAHGTPLARKLVRERVLARAFAHPGTVEQRWFGEERLRALRAASPDEHVDLAEAMADGLIAERHRELMHWYTSTLRDYFHHQRVPQECYEWLLTGVEHARNAVTERPAPVDPSIVWDGAEFALDLTRGQAVAMRVEPHPEGKVAAGATARHGDVAEP